MGKPRGTLVHTYIPTYIPPTILSRVGQSESCRARRNCCLRSQPCARTIFCSWVPCPFWRIRRPEKEEAGVAGFLTSVPLRTTLGFSMYTHAEDGPKIMPCQGGPSTRRVTAE